MPAVALFSKPNGAPIASTHSPTLSPRESPSFTVGRSLAGILMIAMSDFGSTPTTLAVNSRRSVRRTVTSLAPWTTCALVMMTPSGRMMNPEPSPRIGCGCGIWNGWPWKKGANGLFGPKGLLSLGSPLSSEFSSPCELKDADTLLTTLMLTTAGPYFCTMGLKSGSMAGLGGGGGGGRRRRRARGSGRRGRGARGRGAQVHRTDRHGNGDRAEDCGNERLFDETQQVHGSTPCGISRGPWRVT